MKILSSKEAPKNYISCTLPLLLTTQKSPSKKKKPSKTCLPLYLSLSTDNSSPLHNPLTATPKAASRKLASPHTKLAAAAAAAAFTHQKRATKRRLTAAKLCPSVCLCLSLSRKKSATRNSSSTSTLEAQEESRGHGIPWSSTTTSERARNKRVTKQ